jgi:hypothetical protein
VLPGLLGAPDIIQCAHPVGDALLPCSSIRAPTGGRSRCWH